MASDLPCRTVSVRIACPGHAHATHGACCLVCDLEDHGFITALLTPPEVEALIRLARGIPVESCISWRLLKLRLVGEVAGVKFPTRSGYEAIASENLSGN